MKFSEVQEINASLNGETKEIHIENVGTLTVFDGQNPIVLSKDVDILVYDDHIRLKASQSNYKPYLEWLKQEIPGRLIEVEVTKVHQGFQSIKITEQKLKDEGANPAFIKRFKEEAKIRPVYKVICDNHNGWDYLVYISASEELTYHINKRRKFLTRG